MADVSTKPAGFDLTEVPSFSHATRPPAEGAAVQKRGFKPRWLRLQRRERKLKEARVLASRVVIG